MTPGGGRSAGVSRPRPGRAPGAPPPTPGAGVGCRRGPGPPVPRRGRLERTPREANSTSPVAEVASTGSFLELPHHRLLVTPPSKATPGNGLLAEPPSEVRSRSLPRTRATWRPSPLNSDASKYVDSDLAGAGGQPNCPHTDVGCRHGPLPGITRRHHACRSAWSCRPVGGRAFQVVLDLRCWVRLGDPFDRVADLVEATMPRTPQPAATTSSDGAADLAPPATIGLQIQALRS